MASRAPGWIHMKFHHFSIKNQLKNGIKSSRLGSYEVCSFFNEESIKEWPQEHQAGFIWNLIICQLRILWRMASRAPGWILMKIDNCLINNQSKIRLKIFRPDLHGMIFCWIKNRLKNGLQRMNNMTSDTGLMK